MIFYIEKNCKNNPIVQKVLGQFQAVQTIVIDNYKNIFDKTISASHEKIYVFATLNNAICEAPNGYGFSGTGFFLKNSLNCVFDCSYCYLKGAFKNDIQVFFVNYQDMQSQILDTLHKNRTQEKLWFYSSDYSDNLATENMSGFCENMIPFFESLPNVMMEIRTKSVNIAHLEKYQNIQNTEIAFSLNPTYVVEKYEKNTPSLKARIKAINTLLGRGWKIGIRFLPLLEFPGYQQVYSEFLTAISQEIDFDQIHSVFIGGLMYTHDDYNSILKKYPKLDILYRLQKNTDGFYRESSEVRDWFYQKFTKTFPQKKCNICLDEYGV